MLETLHIPSDEEYANGVRVVTYHLQRQNPKAKLTSFIETANHVRQSLPPGINEAVMIGEEGHLLEGLSSNFFAVLDHEIWTAEQGVLSGITRSMVLDVASQEGLTMHLEGLPAEKLSLVDEVFITSASRAVLPVTEIDGKPVGSGRPGVITLLLLRRYREMIEQALETL
jgi:branched-subunit amino acid aminotransferase/4-amino-4-deoxychorismate lyase